jgi:hypothetical protein
MKKATLTLTFGQEKLEAIRYFSEQKGVTLQDELDAVLQKLYEKYVPEQTRKYIESKPETSAIPKRATGSDEYRGV